MAEADVAALERVFHRLVVATDDRLESILETLLPRLLPLLNDAGTRPKVLEIVSHLLKRLKAFPAPRLPMQSLAQLVHSDGPFVRNFSLLFLKMGAKGPQSDLPELLYTLLHGVASLQAKPFESEKSLALSILCLVTQLADAISDVPSSRSWGSLGERDVGMFRRWFVYIFQLELRQLASLDVPADVDRRDGVVPPLPVVQALAKNLGDWSPETHVKRKLSLLKLIVMGTRGSWDAADASGYLPITEVLALLMIAAHDVNSVVATRAGELLSPRLRAVRFATHKEGMQQPPEAELELANRLTALLGEKAMPEEGLGFLLPSRVRVKLLEYATRCCSLAFSKAEGPKRGALDARSTALALEAMLGQFSGPQLRKAGAEFALFFATSVPDEVMPRIVKPFGVAALAVLRHYLAHKDEAQQALDFAALASERACRIACYSLCDVLCQRRGVEGLQADFCDLVGLFFGLLEAEEDDAGLSVTAVLGTLRESYVKHAVPLDVGKFEQLVVMKGPSEIAKLRHQKLRFGMTVLPFSHVPMRKMCVLLAADVDRNVRTAAMDGLTPAKGTDTHPSFPEMVYELLPPTGKSLLDEDDKCVAVGLQFLLHCLQQELAQVESPIASSEEVSGASSLERLIAKLAVTGLMVRDPVLAPLMRRQEPASPVRDLFQNGRGYNYAVRDEHWDSWVSQHSQIGVSVHEPLGIFLHAILSGVRSKTPETALVAAEVLASFVSLNTAHVVSSCGVERHLRMLQDVAIGSEGTKPALARILVGVVGTALPFLSASDAENVCKRFRDLVLAHAQQDTPNPGRENRVRAAVIGLGYASLHATCRGALGNVLTMISGVVDDLLALVDSSKPRDAIANDAACSLALMWLSIEPHVSQLDHALPRICDMTKVWLKSYAGSTIDMDEKNERSRCLISCLGCAGIGLGALGNDGAVRFQQMVLDAILGVPGPVSLGEHPPSTTPDPDQDRDRDRDRDREPCSLITPLPYDVSLALGSALSGVATGLPSELHRDAVLSICEGPAKASSPAARSLAAVYLLSLVSIQVSGEKTTTRDAWDSALASSVQEALLYLVQNPGSSRNSSAELASESAVVALYKLYHQVASQRDAPEAKRMQTRLLVDLCRILKLYSSGSNASAANVQSLGTDDNVDPLAFIQSLVEAFREETAENQTDARPDPSFAPLATRELCRVAVEAGYPQSIYALLPLTVSHAAWQSHEGSHLTLPSIEDEEGRAILQGLPPSQVLLPIVFARKYDPNATIRAVMRKLWSHFSAETNEQLLMQQNFQQILKQCLSFMESPKWRERECAAAALADLLNWLRGMGVDRAGPGATAKKGSHTEVLQIMVEKVSDMWSTCLSLAEDSRESTVLAAMKCCRSMASFSAMICSPLVAESSDGASERRRRQNPYASEAVKAVLPHVMGERVRTRANAAKAACVFALMKVVTASMDAVDPQAEDPHGPTAAAERNPWASAGERPEQPDAGIFAAETFPELVEALVNLQSDLESAVLPSLQNQLAFQEEYGSESSRTNPQNAASAFAPSMSSEGFEEERLRLNASAPLSECLHRLLRFTPDASKVPLLRSLTSTMLHASGLASRSAAADVLVSIIESLGKRDDRVFESDISEALSAVSVLTSGVLSYIFRERSPALRRRFQRVLTVSWAVLERDGVRASMKKLVETYMSLRVDEDDEDTEIAANGEEQSKLAETEKGLSDFARQKLTVAKLAKALLVSTAQVWNEKGEPASGVATAGDAQASQIQPELSLCLALAFASRFESGRIGVVWAEVFGKLKDVLDLSDQDLLIGHVHDARPGSWICTLVRLLVKLLVSRGYNARKRGCFAVSALCGDAQQTSTPLSSKWELQVAHMERLLFHGLAYACSRGYWRGKEEAVRSLATLMERGQTQILDPTTPRLDDTDGASPAEHRWDQGLVADFVEAQRVREDLEAQRWQPGKEAIASPSEPSDADLLGESPNACPRVQLGPVVRLLLSLADPEGKAKAASGEEPASKEAASSARLSSGEEDKISLAAVHAIARISRALKGHPQMAAVHASIAASLQRHLAYGLGMSAGTEAAIGHSGRMKAEHISALLLTLAHLAVDSIPQTETLLRTVHWVFAQDGEPPAKVAAGPEAGGSATTVAYAFPWNIRVAALKAACTAVQHSRLSLFDAGSKSTFDRSTDFRSMLLRCVRHSLVLEAKHAKVREAGVRVLLAMLENTGSQAIPTAVAEDVAELVGAAASDRVPAIHELGRRCEEFMQQR